MRKLKLKLEIDDLEVTSFTLPANARVDRGTVEGHVTAPVATQDGGYTCDGSYTCYQTCANTCQGTCSGGVCGSWPLTYCPQCYYNEV
ncbi:MAG TPA: hypothetical protein VF006_09155 [Longimicrobium sp.]